ncbi:MAG: hypothetical protein E7099_00890 [Mediterranea massiliensis]|nr:hypothetical protein [Mediterranea massiliensis]
MNKEIKIEYKDAIQLYHRLQNDIASYQPRYDKTLLAQWLELTSNDFASRLQRDYTNLTPTEQNICYLQRLGCNLQQMADALHMKKRSVERNINRICKKLCIESSQSSFRKYILEF